MATAAAKSLIAMNVAGKVAVSSWLAGRDLAKVLHVVDRLPEVSERVFKGWAKAV
jgi:hypothetical protein